MKPHRDAHDPDVRLEQLDKRLKKVERRSQTPVTGAGAWIPYVEALGGGADPDDYAFWDSGNAVSDHGAGAQITTDPADHRIIYFPAQIDTGFPNAVYLVKIVGDDSIPASPYSISVYAMSGVPGAWGDVFGGGGSFPFSGPIGIGSIGYGYWQNFASTDTDPLQVSFLYPCYHHTGDPYNALAVHMNGGPVAGQAFEITIVQVQPGNF